jgi:putative endonuclease
MYFVYVMKSKINGRLYKGITGNIEKRLKDHNSGKTRTTKKWKPYELVYFEAVNDRIEARKREKYFKTLSGSKYLKAKMGP